MKPSNSRLLNWVVGTVGSLLLGACTYAPPVPAVSIANHVYLPGTDSIGIAVYAAEVQRPTGIAAFPDGGSARIGHERAIFYLCVAPPGASTPVVRRIAVVSRPDSLHSGFTPWLSAWDGPDRLLASLRGYVGNETRPSDHRKIWIAVDLTGRVQPIDSPAMAGSTATSLPSWCETAALSDARTTLHGSP